MPRGPLCMKLLCFTPFDDWTWEEACRGKLTTGGTGSGKTSGLFDSIIRLFFRAGCGGIFLCVQKDNSRGATIEFVPFGFRDLEAAKSLFRRALRRGAHGRPSGIHTGLAPTYSSAIAELNRCGEVGGRCRHGSVQDLNPISEQDHRFIKEKMTGKQRFRLCGAAKRTIQGDEAMQRSDGSRVVTFVDMPNSSTSSMAWRPYPRYRQPVTTLPCRP